MRSSFPSTRAFALWLPFGVVACGSSAEEGLSERPDPGLLTEGLAQVSPEPWIDLVEDTSAWAGDLSPCADSERIEEFDDEGGLLSVRESWSGPCELADGSFVRGHLERFEDEDRSWLAGRSFQLLRDDETVFLLDGAVELGGQGDLLLLDAAASTCGAPGQSCEEGVHTLDLTWTVYPAHGYPEAYDATVSGVVGSVFSGVEAVGDEDVPMSVEGTWSIDSSACELEPASGTIAVQRGERHAVELDGLEECDACATWVVQGVDGEAFCELSL